MSKSVKRSMRNFSAEGKLSAIQRVHDGESKASVARDIGVPESTLRGWCKNEAKIRYLSRQSSPDTDESMEPAEKQPRLDDSDDQPFNLSLRPSTSVYPANSQAPSTSMYTPNAQLATTSMYTPSSQSLYTPMDCSSNDLDSAPKTPQNLSIKTEIPKSTASQTTERERTRAELARMSVELGLNQPEMFTSNSANSSLADMTFKFNLLSQWHNVMLQYQHLTKKTATSASPGSSKQSSRSSKEQQLTEDYLCAWFKAQEALMVGQNRTNGISPAVATTSAPSTSNGVQNNALWAWYKELYNQPSTSTTSTEKPILYQQLTKDAAEAGSSAAERPATSAACVNHNRGKSVLDNLLNINNNNNNNNNVTVEKNCDGDRLSDSEAVEHGDKFLKWLESSYSDPSVTALHIMQFRSLLNNVKNSVHRKNGDLQNKTKVKRK